MDIAFENFIRKVLAVTQEFATEKEASVMFGEANLEANNFILGESPLRGGLFYYVTNSYSKAARLYLRFWKETDVQFRLLIDNGTWSITLGQDLTILNTFYSESLTRFFNDIKGDFKERLMNYLYGMW